MGVKMENDITNKKSNIALMDEKEFQFKIEIYKSLREEALAKMERQYKVIGLGVGGIGVLLGIAFQFKVYPLFLIIPLSIIASMVIFDSERGAMFNIGKYMRRIERELICETNVQGWENWLIEKAKGDNKLKRRTYMHFDYAALSILLVLLVGCIIGIIEFKGDISGFEGLTNFNIRFAIALFYSAVGFYFWYLYCRGSR
jgi:hypothetical protein